MAARIRIYVDTSALIAFLDRSDTFHPLFRRLFGQAQDLLTTTLVIAEGHGWFLRRYDRTRALQFLAVVEDMKPLAVLEVGATELAGASKLLRKFSDQDLTLTDAVGLHVIHSQRIKRCWSTDFHLRLTGAALAIDDQ